MKNNRKILVWATLAMSLFIQCKPAERTFKVRFDSTKEVSGKKFALKDMNPELHQFQMEHTFLSIIVGLRL